MSNRYDNYDSYDSYSTNCSCNKCKRERDSNNKRDCQCKKCRDKRVIKTCENCNCEGFAKPLGGAKPRSSLDVTDRRSVKSTDDDKCKKEYCCQDDCKNECKNECKNDCKKGKTIVITIN